MENVLRSINLIVELIIISWLAIRRIRYPEKYPKGGLRRDFWVMTLLWTLAALVGTFEQLFETGTYFRIVLTMAALLTTLSILLRPANDWPTPDWKKSQSR